MTNTALNTYIYSLNLLLSNKDFVWRAALLPSLSFSLSPLRLVSQIIPPTCFYVSWLISRYSLLYQFKTIWNFRQTTPVNIAAAKSAADEPKLQKRTTSIFYKMLYATLEREVRTCLLTTLGCRMNGLFLSLYNTILSLESLWESSKIGYQSAR